MQHLFGDERPAVRFLRDVGGDGAATSVRDVDMAGIVVGGLAGGWGDGWELDATVEDEEGGGDKPSKKSVSEITLPMPLRLLMCSSQRPKKRVVRDEDEEETAAPRRKQM